MSQLLHHSLLLCGYIHDVERNINLNMVIDHDLFKLIFKFYFDLFAKCIKFGVYDEKIFTITNNGYEIKGTPSNKYSKSSSAASVVYSESLNNLFSNNNGFDSGVHFISIQSIVNKNSSFDDNSCEWRKTSINGAVTILYRGYGMEEYPGRGNENSIGITKNKRFKHGSFYSFCEGKMWCLTESDVTTIKLDLDSCEIGYFINGKLSAKMLISANTRYYISFWLHIYDIYTHLEIINNDILHFTHDPCLMLPDDVDENGNLPQTKCGWKKCGKTFSSRKELFNHLRKYSINCHVKHFHSNCKKVLQRNPNMSTNEFIEKALQIFQQKERKYIKSRLILYYQQFKKIFQKKNITKNSIN